MALYLSDLVYFRWGCLIFLRVLEDVCASFILLIQYFLCELWITWAVFTRNRIIEAL